MNREEKINAVNTMIKFMEAHYLEEMSLKKIADSCGYSPCYASRLFKQLTGKALFEHLRALRLTKAALRLRDEDNRIIDIAFDFHFNSHEGFTKAFSRQFGIAPKAYSKKTPPIKLFMPYRVDNPDKRKKGDDMMSEKKELRTVFVQVVDREARKFIIRRGIKATDYFKYCEEVSCDIWGVLTSIKGALNEPMGVWLPDNMIKPGTSQYAQGVEVPLDFDGELPEGCELIDLPECKMMIFQGQPYDDEDFEVAIQEVWKAIDGYDPKFYGFEWAPEDAPRFQLEPLGYRGYIEGRPVRAIKK
jgi:AraC-like DNA-binding protein